MAKRHPIRFVPADWLRDTSCLTVSARGVWIDILCYLWTTPQRGTSTESHQSWADRLHLSIDQWEQFLSELRRFNICDITESATGQCTLTSRRMLREDLRRQRQRIRQQRHRDKPSGTPGTLRPIPRSTKTVNPTPSNGTEAKTHAQTNNEDFWPETVKQSKPERSPKRQKATTKEDANCSSVWTAYAEAYAVAYGVAPVRNARVNATIAQLVARLGETEAAAVAGWYPTHRAHLYVHAGHPTTLLLRDAEKLRTEWARGRTMTSTQARQVDQRETMRHTLHDALQLLESRDAD